MFVEVLEFCEEVGICKMEVHDMLKLHSPFVRVTKEHRFVVTPEIAEGYEWVFSDDSVIAVEKLNGTNVSIVVENCEVTSIWNRTERIFPFHKHKTFIMKGLLESFDRGYVDGFADGQYFGELIGPRVNGNPYNLEEHLWVPFSTYARNHLAYKSWGKYPKTFEAISEWFKGNLFSLFMLKRGVKKDDPNHFVEGVVFTHPDGRMAKLRRDMFEWYAGTKHGD